jgi:hypothetical protein
LAVIIKGKSRGNGAQLGKYLVTQGKNEHIRVIEVRGVTAEDVPGAVREMDALALGARTEKGLYHAQINSRADEPLTDEQRAIAVDRLEEKLGLTGQPRVVVVHEKNGREHCHVVWSRIDLDRMAAISDSNNYRKHEEVARALEREFGHERVQGAHAERDGNERPVRTPSHSEMLQSERTGVSRQQAKELITGTWNTTKNGKEFQAGLAKKGWILARGDRRDFVAIDPTGGTHSIARRIEGAKAADVRQRFADIDPRDLSSVAEAKQVQRERQDERWLQAAMETDRTGVRPKAAMATMSQLWHACHNGKTFRASLEQKSWVLARGDRGGFVAIDSAGGTHNLAHRIQGATGADIRQRFVDIDPASLPSVAEARKLQQERQAERTQQAATRAAGQARPDAGHARASVKPRERAAPVGGKAGAVASRLAGSVFSALMGEKPVPKQKESEASKRAKDAGTPSERRQELMRQLSREIPQETERDAEYERDRNERDRGRERSR